MYAIMSAFFVFTSFVFGASSSSSSHPPLFALNPPVSLSVLHQHDFHQAIEKMQRTHWHIRNDTEAKVKIGLKGVSSKGEFSTTVKIKPHQHYVTEVQVAYEDITIAEHKFPFSSLFSHQPNLYLNLDGDEVSVAYFEVPFFPEPVEIHDFTPCFLPDPIDPKAPETVQPAVYLPPQYCIDVLSEKPTEPGNLTPAFIKQYNDNIRYVLYCQFKNEHVDPTEYFKKLNKVYKKNRLENGVFPPKASSVDAVKIPPITHTLWFTSTANPTEFPEEYLFWLKKSIEACPKEHGFSHWFWVADKKKLPKTVKRVKKMGCLVHEVSELGDFELKDVFNHELANRRFGRASDIFRLIVLDKFGGVYKDTDYRIHQSLLPLLSKYHFVGCREPQSTFLCNALMATCPNHPVIRDYIDLVARNYDPHRVPDYIRNIPDSDGFKTILITGPAVLATAIAHAMDQEGYTDIVLPHMYLYPTPVEAYPQQNPVKPGMPVPLPAFGVHYWETSWAAIRADKFGSFG